MTREKWSKRSLKEQMGNIGSEFFRMLSLKEKGDLKNSKDSFIKVLELIDLTTEDKRWRKRLFEVLRSREIICDLFFDTKQYNISIDHFKKYFINFAL